MLCALSWVTGCASKKKKPEPSGTGQATLIGMIEMVNPEQNYVLIRCEPMPNLQPGTELIALSATGERCKLVLTPEKKGYYVTADIKEGNPGVTNLVLLQHSAAPPPPTPENPPAEPAPSTSPPAFQPLPELPGMPAIPSTSVPPLPLTHPGESPESKAPAEAPKSDLGELVPPVGNAS